MKLQVETTAEQEPTCFFVGHERIVVIDIIDRWPGFNHTYFKVQADDGNRYILRHHQHDDQWVMIYFQSGHLA